MKTVKELVEDICDVEKIHEYFKKSKSFNHHYFFEKVIKAKLIYHSESMLGSKLKPQMKQFFIFHQDDFFYFLFNSFYLGDDTQRIITLQDAARMLNNLIPVHWTDKQLISKMLDHIRTLNIKRLKDTLGEDVGWKNVMRKYVSKRSFVGNEKNHKEAFAHLMSNSKIVFHSEIRKHSKESKGELFVFQSENGNSHVLTLNHDDCMCGTDFDCRGNKRVEYLCDLLNKKKQIACIGEATNTLLVNNLSTKDYIINKMITAPINTNKYLYKEMGSRLEFFFEQSKDGAKKKMYATSGSYEQCLLHDGDIVLSDLVFGKVNRSLSIKNVFDDYFRTQTESSDDDDEQNTDTGTINIDKEEKVVSIDDDDCTIVGEKEEGSETDYDWAEYFDMPKKDIDKGFLDEKKRKREMNDRIKKRFKIEDVDDLRYLNSDELIEATLDLPLDMKIAIRKKFKK